MSAVVVKKRPRESAKERRKGDHQNALQRSLSPPTTRGRTHHGEKRRASFAVEERGRRREREKAGEKQEGPSHAAHKW